MGGYGAQDRGEAEVLGEWNLLPVAFSLALDGVLLSVAYIVVVGIDDPRLHHGVDSREAFVDDDEAQGVCTGRSLGVVRRLFFICHRLPCRWLARGEVESSKHHKSNSPEFLLIHFFLRLRVLHIVSYLLKSCKFFVIIF